MPKPKKDPTVADREWIAAQLLAASEGLISTAQAMKSVGLKSPQRSETRKKSVYRQAPKITIVGNDRSYAVPATTGTPRQLLVEPNPDTTEHQSISSLSATPSNSTSGTSHGPSTQDRESLRRQLVDGSVAVSTDDNPRPKKHRRSSTHKTTWKNQKRTVKEENNLQPQSLPLHKLWQ